MWRAEDHRAIDVPAVEKLTRNEQRLNRLSDTDIVGNQKAHGVELQCH
jgi:hypothetical protein